MKAEKPKIYSDSPRLPKGTKKIDALERTLVELFFVENPTIPKDAPAAKKLVKEFIAQRLPKEKGVWAYYPWHKTAIRIPSEKIYHQLRTIRNRNLITEKEQKNYRDARIG